MPCGVCRCLLLFALTRQQRFYWQPLAELIHSVPPNTFKTNTFVYSGCNVAQLKLPSPGIVQSPCPTACHLDRILNIFAAQFRLHGFAWFLLYGSHYLGGNSGVRTAGVKLVLMGKDHSWQHTAESQRKVFSSRIPRERKFVWRDLNSNPTL